MQKTACTGCKIRICATCGLRQNAKRRYFIRLVTAHPKSVGALGIARNYVEEVRSRTAIPASEGATAVDETGTAAGGGKYQRSLTIADLGNIVVIITGLVLLIFIRGRVERPADPALRAQGALG